MTETNRDSGHDLTSHDLTSHDLTSHDLTSHDLTGPALKQDVVQDAVMLQNIREQPKVIGDCLTIALNLPKWFTADSVASPCGSRFILLACGSSRHAALVAQHWFESIAQCPVRVLDSAAWCDRSPLLEANATIIALSQSGKTKDLLDALAQIRSSSPTVKVFAIANVADSPLVQRADAAIVMPAGLEGAVAATKSFTAQLTLLARIAVEMAEAKALIGPAFRSDLEQLPECLETTLLKLRHSNLSNLKDPNFNYLPLGKGMARHWMNAKSIVLLGRGNQHPIALEGALKLKETCYVHAEGFEAGDFCHGPMAILEPGFPVIALMPDTKMRSNLDRFRHLGSYVIGIGGGDQAMLSGLDEVIEVECLADWLMPFFTVIPLQLLAYDWAKIKGLDVDQPRYLTKFIG